ncbi:MAG: hypothetical protein GY716_04385 [bacterium]|nr:hypothetical protein [bacterium]
MTSANEKIITELHQRASGLYYQGQVQSALEAWQQILLLDPADERALEGVRLCEAYEPDCAPAGPPAPAAAGQPESLEESLTMLDQILGEGPGAAPPAAAAAGAAAAEAVPETPLDTAAGFDFDLSELENVDIQEPQPQPPAPAAEEEVGPGPTPLNLSAFRDVDHAAEAEDDILQRVKELLADARGFYERGDRDNAMTSLSRLFILDEDNADAAELRRMIRADVESDPAAEASPEPVEDEPFDEVHDPTAMEGDGLDALALGRPAESAEATATADYEPAPEFDDTGGFDPLNDVDPSGSASEPGEEWSEAELDAEGGESAPRAATASRKIPKWAVIAACSLVVVTGVVFLLMRLLADEPVQINAPGPAAPVPTTADLSQKVDELIGQNPQTPEAVQAANEQQVGVLMASAGEAYENGEYAAAVVDFKAILDIAPDDADAKRGLVDAGERYREQQRIEQKWGQAREDFEHGNYRAALSGLYRLPATRDAAELERYKRNGWFNLGIQSLERSDCKTAREHFKEAMTLDPDDAGSAYGIQAARSCEGVPTELAYRTLTD